MIKKIIVILSLLVVPLTSLAHLAAGEDKRVGDYYIDFGWQPEKIQAQETTTFTVSVIDWQTKIAPQDAVLADVLIVHKDNEVFKTQIELNNGVATMHYSFPHGGDYVYKLLFKTASDKVIVSTQYELEVADILTAYYGAGLIFIIIESVILLGAIVGLIFLWFARRKRKAVEK